MWIFRIKPSRIRYHYTFTTFDVETLDLEDFKYNQVNITAFRWEKDLNQRSDQSIFMELNSKYRGKKREFFLYPDESLRFVDSESRRVQRTLQEMEDFSPIGSSILNKSGVNINLFKGWRENVWYILHWILHCQNNPQLIQTEPAMLFDSVHVFARGLEAASLDGPELRIRWDYWWWMCLRWGSWMKFL